MPFRGPLEKAGSNCFRPYRTSQMENVLIRARVAIAGLVIGVTGLGLAAGSAETGRRLKRASRAKCAANDPQCLAFELAYIRSGAAIPRRLRPVARTRAVNALRASLDVRIAGSALSTWHCS